MQRTLDTPYIDTQRQGLCRHARWSLAQLRRRMDATIERRSGLIPGLTPYFECPGAAIYHGESLRILPLVPAGLAAAAVTDPPYSSGGMSIAERSMDPREKYCHSGNDLGRPSFAGDNRDQRSYAFWATLWMAELQRIVRRDGYGLVFTDWRQLPVVTDILQAAGWIWRGIIPWDKGRGSRAPHKGYFRHQCEYVAWSTNGRCLKRETDGPLDGCFRVVVKQSDKHHITGKPTELLRDLVRCVDPGELVIDPFAGSGTTGVACLQTGRRTICIEQSEAYCEIAAKRLEQAAKDGPIAV